MCTALQPKYVNFGEDITLDSNANGSPRKHVVTPHRLYPLGLGCKSFTAGLRFSTTDSNVGVTGTFQYSLDRRTWRDGSAAIITEKTTGGDYVGVMSTAAELVPFIRLVIEVRDTTATTQKTVTVTTWGYYQYI